MARKSEKNQQILQMLETLRVEDYFDPDDEDILKWGDAEEIKRRYNALNGNEKDYLGNDEIKLNFDKKRKKELIKVIDNKEKPELTLNDHEEQVSAQQHYVPLSHEDRFLAKTRISVKTKKSVDKLPKTKAGERVRKITKHFQIRTKKQHDELIIRPVSVRKELKKLFEEGLVEWKHNPEQKELAAKSIEKIKTEFSQWMFLLNEGFNIILYGYGSKICVFEALDEYLGEKFTVIELDGLNLKLEAKEVLNDFVECLNTEVTLEGSNLYIKVRNMMAKLRLLSGHPPIILLVRNIENISYKNDQLFYLITSISTLPFVHLIASTDHVNSPLAFDQGISTDMKLHWIKCSTYAPYDIEAQSIGGGTLGPEAFEDTSCKITLEHVYGSVTLKAKQAFNILASLQIQAVRSRNFDVNLWGGIAFNELARYCREKFIANNDTQLNHLLVEFFDNKLISKNRSTSSTDDQNAPGTSSSSNRFTTTRKALVKTVENCLKINLDDAKLEEFILANPINSTS